MNSITRMFFTRQRDTNVLLLVILVGVILCFSSGTGLDFWPVLGSYIGFFGPHYVIFFLASRFYLRWSQSWQPTSSIGDRLLKIVGGKPEATQAIRTDWELARGTLLFLISITVYTNIKVRIPIINTALHDTWIANLDQSMFFTDFVAFGQYVVSAPLLDTLLTRGYLHGYIFMAFLAFFLYIRQDHYRIRLLFVSASFMYLFGILITLAMPTVGPWFAFDENWSWMLGHTMAQEQLGLKIAWDQAVAVATDGGVIDVTAFRGVAALPSLHVGHMALMMFISWHSRYLFWYAIAMFELVLITSAATVAYGWHYLLDAPAGILLAFICLKLVDKLMSENTKSKGAGDIIADTS